ncbi:hypothetical protein [Stutzerimonas nitrititolerans]|uniref:hypothetical protein n=1 Tax=Stutzerimonas nitrititolerans TaxID=2482751 RepID=UPI0028AA9217|nr:hypothetical protein [Stutzerimonas nitrititolerans]
MNIRTLVLLLGLSLAVPVQADAPGRVWVYQPDGASYRIGGGAYRYDPRSPYPQHRQYRPNLPPRYQGQLPPQYYDRHRGLDRPQRWDDGRRHGLDRPQRWHHEHRQGSYRRGQGWNQRHDYRPSQRGSFDRRSYRRH